MAGFDDPITLALLGASSGFLDPRGGMIGGFHGAMQGLQAGNEIQRQNRLAQQAQLKIERDMQARQLLQDTLGQQAQSGKTDLRAIGNSLISTGHPELIKQGLDMIKAAPKARSSVKVMKDGQAFFQPMLDSGEFGEVGSSPAAEKLMQINQGSQVGLANPYTGQIQTAVGVGMSPGESARLAQSASQHADNLGMQGQRLMLDRRAQVQPKFQDGAFVYPPTAENPEGRIIPTEMFAPPKGSIASAKASAAKVNGLLDEAEKLIPKATGSLIGSIADSGAAALGVSTEGARNIASLKPIEAGLIMNMPRLEGPQSNYDQQLYREAAGQIGDPSIPTETKASAIRTIRRIQRTYPDAFGNQQSSGSSNSSKNSDGWGELR